jgi:hypothetical protein
MQYMLLIYQDPNGGGPAQGTPEAEARMQEWFSYDSGLKEDGSYVSGAALQGTEEATTVRSRNGGDQLTDGPFAETKEWLAGYYVIDVPDLDSALERASGCPTSARAASRCARSGRSPVCDGGGRASLPRGGARRPRDAHPPRRR